jgi:hypothetical protein
LQRLDKVIGTVPRAPVHQYRHVLQEISEAGEGFCLRSFCGVRYKYLFTYDRCDTAETVAKNPWATQQRRSHSDGG